MTKYLTKSADVLNEADRFQRIMDFKLFTMEQETRLYGYNENTDWVPGTPLYPHPFTIERGTDCECEDCVREEGPLEGYYGNHVRNAIDLYEDGQAYERQRCSDCLVSWTQGDECWMCGKFCERPKSGFQHLPQYATFDVRVSQQMALYLGSMWDRVHEMRAAIMAPSFQRAEQAMRGFRMSFAPIVDEWPHFHFSYDRETVGFESFLGIEPYSYHPPVVPPNLFERAEVEIELVRPVVADLNVPYWGARVDMPVDVDLSGRRSVPLPQRPQPRDFSAEVDRGYRARTNPDYYRRNR